MYVSAITYTCIDRFGRVSSLPILTFKLVKCFANSKLIIFDTAIYCSSPFHLHAVHNTAKTAVWLHVYNFTF